MEGASYYTVFMGLNESSPIDVVSINLLIRRKDSANARLKLCTPKNGLINCYEKTVQRSLLPSGVLLQIYSRS